MSRAKSSVGLGRIALAAALLMAVVALSSAPAQNSTGTQSVTRDPQTSTRSPETPKGEKAKADSKESEGFKFDTPSIVGLSALGVLFLIGVFWLLGIARRQAEQDRQEAARYEAEVLSDADPQTVSLMISGAEPPGGGAAAAKASPLPPASAPVQAPSMLATGSGGLALDKRLAAAGLLKSLEGRLYIGDGDAREEAQLVELKDGRQALLLNALPPPAELHKQLRRCELIIVASPDGDPLVVTPFGQLISDQFRR